MPTLAVHEKTACPHSSEKCRVVPKLNVAQLLLQRDVIWQGAALADHVLIYVHIPGRLFCNINFAVIIFHSCMILSMQHVDVFLTLDFID